MPQQMGKIPSTADECLPHSHSHYRPYPITYNGKTHPKPMHESHSDTVLCVGVACSDSSHYRVMVNQGLKQWFTMTYATHVKAHRIAPRLKHKNLALADG